MKPYLSFLALFLCLTCSVKVDCQTATLISGPMIGHTEFRTSQVWLQLSASVPSGALQLQVKGGKTYNAWKEDNSFVNNYKFSVTELEPGTSYNYDILLNKKKIASGMLRTQQLWQWRTTAPDFSFIAGSCAYFNQPQYDRPGKPYGGDSSIFETMGKEKADFMLWLGDNWYTREVDYYSEAGLSYRPSKDRSFPILQPLLKNMAHYAIWDDHDYGVNDGDKSYHLKEASRKTFKSFWGNPSYGMNDEGIYTKFTWNDVDVFMLDDRYFRTNDDMPDSIKGVPNTSKKMYGDKQLDWLKNALLQSRANGSINFRIIATGSQVLNLVSPYDCLCKYKGEFKELMDFLEEAKINGVIFLTGDRHHSSIMKMDRNGTYPLYDITASPLTSGSYPFGGPEANNPNRLLGIAQKQNYTRFSFSGKGRDRVMKVDFLGIKGELLDSWSIKAADISNARR